MASAYRQVRGRCIEKIIAGLAAALAGLVLMLGDVGLGTVRSRRASGSGSSTQQQASCTRRPR